MSKVHYDQCPVCDSGNVQPLLTVKDHTVSGEDFVIWQCAACTLRFTQDVPDAEDIGPYYKAESYISHTDTRKGLINKLYGSVRNITLESKARLVTTKTGKTNGRLLDVGCGTGAFLHTMQEKGWSVTGIEPDADARAVAAKQYNISPKEPGALFGLEEGSYDAVTLWHVLEHVHDLHGYMHQLKKLLHPGGKLFIAVPNYRSADADAYRLKWAAYDVPRHLYHFSPTAMQILLQRHGFILKDKRPMWFDSFYVSLLSSKYKNGKTNWPGALLTGLRANIGAAIHTDNCSSIIYIAGVTG